MSRKKETDSLNPPPKWPPVVSMGVHIKAGVWPVVSMGVRIKAGVWRNKMKTLMIMVHLHLCCVYIPGMGIDLNGKTLKSRGSGCMPPSPRKFCPQKIKIYAI